MTGDLWKHFSFDGVMTECSIYFNDKKTKQNNKLSYKHAVNVMEAQSKAVFFFVIINTCDDKNIL